MTDINRQKFLAELSKLLTFMYEEDRQQALDMYSAMFDKAQDEAALIQQLISPTRQAVLIARAYDAKERKLQVYAQSREAAEEQAAGEVPKFVLVIDRVAEDVLGDYAPAPKAVLENQFSLFEQEQEQQAEEPEAADAPQEEPAAEQQSEEEYSSLSEVEGFIPIDIPDISVDESQYIPAARAEQPAQQQEAEEELAPVPEEDPAAESGEEKVNAFMADFYIQQEEKDNPHARPADEEAEVGRQQVMAEFEEEQQADNGREAGLAEKPATVRKARVLPLILYILVSVPLGVVGMVLLLALTFLVLGAAIAVIAAGIMLCTAAFGGFSVFADLLAVLGTAIIVLAMGLLLLWLFVWFIGGAMVGFIRGILKLGGKWCFKEVAAE